MGMVTSSASSHSRCRGRRQAKRPRPAGCRRLHVGLRRRREGLRPLHGDDRHMGPHHVVCSADGKARLAHRVHAVEPCSSDHARGSWPDAVPTFRSTARRTRTADTPGSIQQKGVPHESPSPDGHEHHCDGVAHRHCRVRSRGDHLESIDSNRSEQADTLRQSHGRLPKIQDPTTKIEQRIATLKSATRRCPGQEPRRPRNVDRAAKEAQTVTTTSRLSPTRSTPVGHLTRRAVRSASSSLSPCLVCELERGVGFAGAGVPLTIGSIHRTTVPSL